MIVAIILFFFCLSRVLINITVDAKQKTTDNNICGKRSNVDAKKYIPINTSTQHAADTIRVLKILSFLI